MAFEAVIFDCDGTLVDSEPIGNEVLVDYAREFGIELSLQEAIAKFRGGRLSEHVAHLESLRGEALPAAFVPEFRRRLAIALESRLQPIDGALELVRSMTIPFCVASSGPREKIELSLTLTGLLPYFKDRIFSAYEVGVFKPDPGLFLHAARALGAPPECCAVIEDSMPGIQAGLAAGMTVFALTNAHTPHPLPSGVHPVPTLHALRNLLMR